MTIQNVVLVAGFNYENDRNPVFLEGCNNRMARLLQKAKTSHDLVFTLFDVGGGVIKQSAADAKTKKRSWTTLNTFNPVTRANYSTFDVGTENHFDQNPSGTMSITDVYEFIQGLGAGSDPHSVVELSFFSHGWMGGPILVNSFDSTSNNPTQPRDHDDKDARIFKDFIAPNMDATALSNFRAAFAPTGIIWTWGCSFFRPIYLVLTLLFKTSKFRSTPPGKLKDTDQFTLDFLNDPPPPSRTDDFNAIVNDVLPGGRISGRSYVVTATFLQIKNMVRVRLDRTYSKKISVASGVTTFGALPGTYAEQEKKVRLPLMVVPTRDPPQSANLTPDLKFYKTYMGVRLDPEGRGYGRF